MGGMGDDESDEEEMPELEDEAKSSAAPSSAGASKIEEVE